MYENRRHSEGAGWKVLGVYVWGLKENGKACAGRHHAKRLLPVVGEFTGLESQLKGGLAIINPVYGCSCRLEVGQRR